MGFAVSKEETRLCVKDEAGAILAQGKVATDPDALFEALKAHCLCPQRIVPETGTLSGWLARELGKLGIAVDVIDARQAHGVMKLQHNKTDAGDAALLAEIARSGFCRPVAVKRAAAQRDRILLKARAQVVGQRRSLENTIRGLLASLGCRLPKGVGKFAGRVEAILAEHPALSPAISPLLSARQVLERSIERLDREVAERARNNPACRLLMTAPGVGPVTALAFAATLDDPGRFAESRALGAYLGLTSRRYQSGEMDYSGRISKHGDAMLRGLLYEAANVMLTVVRRAHPLKTWARKLKKRTGHKKACVALARKLAVVLHKMLVTGKAFRRPEKETAAA
ncbi:MAG: IS110 family transposase [Kiloniellaceae bacterium]